MPTYSTPGVYPQELILQPNVPLLTGVPALIGMMTRAEADQSGLTYQPLASGGWLVVPPHAAASSPSALKPLTLWTQFAQRFGAAANYGHLAQTVYGFFQNGGSKCYPLTVCVETEEAAATATALQDALNALASNDDVDLVCAPDIMRWPDLGKVQIQQNLLLDHCAVTGDRFAVLDALPGGESTALLDQVRGMSSPNGALYFPWLDVGDRSTLGRPSYVPPSGYIAGIYARSDLRVGVHKAPANEIIEGVLDLEINLTNAQQGNLNEAGINCLRSFPGRGIRVWGARTLSDDPAWRYVNVRRLFQTAGRWIGRTLADVAFEPNDPLLWSRIEREISTYCAALLQDGALRGDTAEHAFFVRCDTSTNSPDNRDRGEVVTEIGLAPSQPNEFIVVRIIHGPSGVTLTGPNLAA